MKRTYVDVIGEYYDSLDDLILDANQFGVRDFDLMKAFSARKTIRKQHFNDD